MFKPQFRRSGQTRRAAACIVAAVGPLFVGLTAYCALAGNLNGTVSFFTIDTSAYGTGALNSSAISRNNLVTIGNYQYTAYYRYNSATSGTIIVGRRATNSSSFALVNTNITLNNNYNGAIDGHDIVAMAVDGNGDMHLSWGMHNNPLNYAISTSVDGSTFNPTFTTQTAANNPALFSQITSSGINQVTYPEFYYIPNGSGAPSGNLVFDYRDAASNSGGGSGNGNTIFGSYNFSNSSFTSPAEVIGGGITSVNAYPNRLAYDSRGNLIMTWTWRSTPNFQSNSNVMYAQSPDNGKTWYHQGGAAQYTLPIIANTSNGGSGSQVAQVVYNIAQNSSLINQTSMTVDNNDRPVIATWMTPNGTASSPVSSTNNPNRQYVLQYYTGTTWAQSQITHRTSDTAFDTSGTFVSDLGRPIVLVDSSNRVIVIGRSEDTGMGSYNSASTPNNNLTVYWNTMASLDSTSPQPWKSFALDTANMGAYEPSYDPTAWSGSGLLDLFHEPVGLSNESTGTAQVLQWNESAFNFSSASPAVMTWNANASGTGIVDGGGTWNFTNTNFSDGYSNYAWNSNFATGAIFGAKNGAAGTVTLGGNIVLSSLVFNVPGSGSYNIAGGGFSLNLSNNMSVVANANATISASIITSGTLTKTGVGILTLSGSNNFSGGVLQIGKGAVNGGMVNGGICVTSAAALNGVATVSLVDNNSAHSIFQMNGSGGDISLPATVSFNINANNDGPSASGATIVESIAGNNTVAGNFSLNVGGKGYGFAVDSGSLTFTANISQTHVLFLRGAGNGAFNGKLTGTGSIEIDGPGIWSLGGADSYSGTTTVAGGTLNIASGASITSTAVTVSKGGTMNAFGSLATGTTLVAGGNVNLQPNTGSGIFTRTLASVDVSSGGTVALVKAPLHANRTLLVSNAPVFGGATNAWVGKIDLANNDAVAHNGSIASISNQIAEGYNGGMWNGTAGFISSAAASDPTHLTTIAAVQNTLSGNTSGAVLYGAGSTLGNFDGYAPLASDVLLKYTYFGDANLDGTVDGTDYSLIDTGFASQRTPSPSSGWRNGDFNYDGHIDGSDYSLIDNAFNAQGTSLVSANAVAAPTAQITVPEPPALGLIAFASPLLIRRRSAQSTRKII